MSSESQNLSAAQKVGETYNWRRQQSRSGDPFSCEAGSYRLDP